MKSLKSITLRTAVNILNNPSVLTLPFFVFVAWATWAVRTHFFFWDTVQLASQHAQFFYDTQFSTFLLPDEMDSGHPPTFGFYLATVWQLFGKSLTNSHLAMLPFLFGIVWQSWRVGQWVLGDGWAYIFMLVILVNPVVASQCVLVSPDVVLIFFFLLALNGIFREKKGLLCLAVLGLAAVSMRGMMVVAALFLFQILTTHTFRKFLKFPKCRFKGSNTEGVQLASSLKLDASYYTQHIAKLTTPYILGGLFALSFFIFHYQNKGWIGYHAGSSWAEAFERVDFKDFIKNIILLVWRLTDFGHLFTAATILFLSLKLWRSFRKFLPTTRRLWLLLILLTLVLTPTLIAYKGLLNHRYLLPIYIVACLLCVKLISDLKNGKLKIGLAVLVFLGLATGNFWVYPQPIATGWDSTLAHLPYYRLRNEMVQFIDNQKISCSDVGTCFPNLRSFRLVDLKTDTTLKDFARLDFEKNRYVFYSNVMNELDEKELFELRNHWKIVHILRGGQVEVILYARM